MVIYKLGGENNCNINHHDIGGGDVDGIRKKSINMKKKNFNMKTMKIAIPGEIR